MKKRGSSFGSPHDTGNANDEVHAKVRRSTYKILLLVRDGCYAGQMARYLNTPASTIRSRLKRLVSTGFVKRDIRLNFRLYKLTAKGYRYIKAFNDELSRYLRQQGKSRLHRLDVRFPIVKDNPNAKLDRINERFTNWMPEYTRVTFPIGLTFMRTTRAIVVKFHEFETENRTCLTDFFSHVLRGCFYAFRFMKDRYGIEIDIPEKITDQHIVNEKPDLRGKVDKRKTVTLGLNRRAKSVVDTDLKGKAWLDHSRGMPEIETNDFLYEERLLSMPEKVDHIENILKGSINQQVATSNALNLLAVNLTEITKLLKGKKK